MELKNKVLSVLALSTMLMAGCGLVPSNKAVEEGTFDSFNNSPTLQLRGQTQVGGDETVSYSDIYAQYGKDSDNNYWVRFATAVKGNISSLTYTRQASPDLNETEVVEKDVQSVYLAINANEVSTYYNGTDLSIEESDKGLYYWACYSIKIANEDYYSTAISMSFKIDGEVVKERTVSLDQLLGEKNTYRFEAEAAKVSGNSGASNANYGHYCFTKSYYHLDALSGSYCLRNLLYLTLTFDFVTSSADDVTLRFHIANNTDTTLDTLMTLNVNDSIIDVSSIAVGKGVQLVENNTYFNFLEVEVPASLVKGNNSIKLTSGTSTFANIDYLEVITSANISGWEDNLWMKNPGENEIRVTTVPSLDNPGVYEVGCSYAPHGALSFDLPALSDEEFYDVEIKDNIQSYYFEAFGGRFIAYQEEIVKKSYTLTINNGTYNGSTSVKVESGNNLDGTLAGNVVDGYEVYGWYDVKTNKEINLSTFTMPIGDVAIAPIYKPTEYVKTGSGWLDYGECIASSTAGYIDNSKNASFGFGSTNSARKTGHIGDGKYGTLIYFSTTNAEAESYFRVKTNYSREKNVSYKQSYYVINLGNESITMTASQVNTGTTKTHSQDIELAVGESIAFEFEYSYTNTNNNIMTLFTIPGVYNTALIGIQSSIIKL